ncbi:EI24-domain-containing protein [Basidiobolus meristosporus CBS 931.73]|uniref:EI24-domain-containing protein n=1 Tax=Basidiobolus meristosporus CBS 931.73 TaxID=1314790 RepID=A0A1Y1Y7Y2_9FUNG|nr:EI24-domain-containing protein [Basidiobolus meristosporus CBS 931.73]|eukprot:ORX94078.1 EI24-domain-containing protein [Basidiobolus meristosporus CBS 931.73]
MIYHLFWVYPIYCISFVLNSTWYQEIADRAYRLQVGKPEAVEKSYDSVLNGMVEVIYEAFLILNYLIFASLVHAIPIVGPFISFTYLCWLNAYYSFEYKWINKGWSLDQRLNYFEEHWAYFAGFGFPGTICSFFFPSFINVGVFALLFPLFIIMANKAVPMPQRPSRARANLSILEKMPIFYLAKKTNLFWIRKLNNTRKASKSKSKSK